MKLAISGAGGLIGTALTQYYRNQNHTVIPISRSEFRSSDEALANLLSGCQVVINLAGAPIFGRWTREYKQQIHDSRILTTQKLVRAMLLLDQKPDVFISASAVGIYPEGGPYTEETTELASNFLGQICQDWEQAAHSLQVAARIILIRIGIVLDRRGGAFPKMLPAFRYGLGGKIGSGKQGFSWIHLQDLVAAVDFLIKTPAADGVYNLCAPNPVTNAAFTRILAARLRRTAFFPVPGFLLKLLYGEASETLTSGQLVIPDHLLKSGFEFRFPTAESAVYDLLPR